MLSQVLVWEQNKLSRLDFRNTIRSNNKSYQLGPLERTLVFVASNEMNTLEEKL